MGFNFDDVLMQDGVGVGNARALTVNDEREIKRYIAMFVANSAYRLSGDNVFETCNMYWQFISQAADQRDFNDRLFSVEMATKTPSGMTRIQHTIGYYDFIRKESDAATETG